MVFPPFSKPGPLSSPIAPCESQNTPTRICPVLLALSAPRQYNPSPLIQTEDYVKKARMLTPVTADTAQWLLLSHE